MSAEKLGTWALALAIAAAGGVAWWLQARPSLVVDASPLARMPDALAAWRSVDLPLESTVEAVLRADFNLQRAYYQGDQETPVWVYVGYYGTARGGRPEHTPRGCYTGAGWDIARTRVLEAEDGSGRRAVEYLVQRGEGGERRLVHFWFRSSRRSGMTGGVDRHLDQILGRLLDGRADGALVRVSTRLDAELSEDAARQRLLSLGRELDRQLAEHWPSELPQGGA